MGRRRGGGGGGYTPPSPPPYQPQVNKINAIPLSGRAWGAPAEGNSSLSKSTTNFIIIIETLTSFTPMYNLLLELDNAGLAYSIIEKRVTNTVKLKVFLLVQGGVYYHSTMDSVLNKYKNQNQIVYSKQLYTYNPTNPNVKRNEIYYASAFNSKTKKHNNLIYHNITSHPKILWTLFGYNFNQKQDYSLRQLEGKNYDLSWLPDSNDKGTILYSFTADRVGKINEYKMLDKMPLSNTWFSGRYEFIYLYYIEVIGTSVKVYKRLFKRLFQ